MDKIYNKMSNILFSGNLNQHIKIHDKSKRNKCDVCSKSFHKKLNSTYHYLSHTGEKPFSSQICDKQYSQKDNLVRHQATHIDVKSFKCAICLESRSYKTKNQLTNHMVYHYEPKFACSQCDYKTHTKQCLNKHTKVHAAKND